MTRFLTMGLAIFAVCFMLGAAAQADPWKDESGKGKGWEKHKKEWKDKEKDWKEHRGAPPPWARGKGYWDGHLKHGRPPAHYHDDFDDDGGRHWHRGSREYWSYGYETVPSPRDGWPPRQPHYDGDWRSYSSPYGSYGWPEASPDEYYNLAPYGQGWDIEGAIRIRPRSDW